MSETSATDTPSRGFPSTLKWILSSTFLAALVALWGTLVGLLYRFGWLSTFGVAPDLFMPESATELTYWGYVAALSIWADWHNLIHSYTWAAFRLGLLCAALVIVSAASALFFIRNKPIIDRQLTRFTAGFWRYVLMYAAICCIALTTLPWIAIAFSGAFVGLPLPGYATGKANAEKAIQSHRKSLSQDTTSCAILVGPAGQIGRCPYVIAQTKTHIAYLEGDKVFVAPANGVLVTQSLPLKQLRSYEDAGSSKKN